MVIVIIIIIIIHFQLQNSLDIMIYRISQYIEYRDIIVIEGLISWYISYREVSISSHPYFSYCTSGLGNYDARVGH